MLTFSMASFSCPLCAKKTNQNHIQQNLSPRTRALLVSHWPVYSEAAVKLTTKTFAALKSNPKMGRAGVLGSICDRWRGRELRRSGIVPRRFDHHGPHCGNRRIPGAKTASEFSEMAEIRVLFGLKINNNTLS